MKIWRTIGLMTAAGLIVIGCAPLNIVPDRPVEVTREVEVTRQVEVTRVVEVPAAAPAASATATPAPSVAAIMTGSLHSTTNGMAYFYSKEQGGLEQLTNVPYEQLKCRSCHILYNRPDRAGQIRCEACHIDQTQTAAPPQAAVRLPYFPDDGRDQGCLACHQRQNYEILATDENGAPTVTDVHRSPAPYGKGMQCVNCHGLADTHGDGQVYDSMLASPSVQCGDCHVLAQLPPNQAHTVHGGNMECDTCHVQTVVACQNCHINTVMSAGPGQASQGFPYERVVGWKFLIQRNGKIAVGNLMSIVYTDGAVAKTFAVIAPFHDHSVKSLKGIDYPELCGQCHANANVREYEQTGAITISRWDDRRQQLVFPARDAKVIPVPVDFRTAFKLSFARIANLSEVIAAPVADQEQTAKWEFARDGVDLWQLLYAEPLARMPPQIQFNFPTPTPMPR
jgi:hypothetical protein